MTDYHPTRTFPNFDRFRERPRRLAGRFNREGGIALLALRLRAPIATPAMYAHL
jgi:hypothetical protein